MGAKESAVAKSHGQQKEQDMTMPDATFFKVLHSKEKISKQEVIIWMKEGRIKNQATLSCIKCKFNLGDEKKCHIVGGRN